MCVCISDGTGYVEDGREIFDDEEAEMDEEESRKREKEKKKGNKKRVRDVNKPVEGNASIRSMFGNVVAKKKENKVNINEDDILADILGEINPESNGNSSTSTATTSKSNTSSVAGSKMNKKTEMALVKDYLGSFSKAVPRKQETKSESISDDVS